MDSGTMMMNNVYRERFPKVIVLFVVIFFIYFCMFFSQFFILLVLAARKLFNGNVSEM